MGLDDVLLAMIYGGFALSCATLAVGLRAQARTRASDRRRESLSRELHVERMTPAAGTGAAAAPSQSTVRSPCDVLAFTPREPVVQAIEVARKADAA